MAEFTTKQLSKRTWPDFVRFFSQGNGWDHCGCTAWHGVRAPREIRKWADKRDWTLAVKCDLVNRGRAHGILVYAGGEPIGWCQFGPVHELPIRDDRPRRKTFEDGEERRWRITCFCTRPDFAQLGVAGIALNAALRAIAKRGGGLVEAFPIAHVQGDWKQDERAVIKRRWTKELIRLRKEFGMDSEQVRRHVLEAPPEAGTRDTDIGIQIEVEGIGPVQATYWGRYHGGTVRMFEREGFRAVAVVPPSTRSRRPGPRPAQLVMHKTVPPAGTGAPTIER